MQFSEETIFQNQFILYIDDAENQLSFKALFRRKFPIFTVGQLSEAKEVAMKYPVKMILSNQQYSTHAAIDFLRWVKRFDSNIVRIFIYCNDYNLTSDDVFNKYKDLAHQYLWKPWNTFEMESVLLKWWEK